MTETVRFAGTARRAAVASPLAMAVNGTAFSVPLSTFGPGDIVGIEPSEILRRVPGPGTVGHPPNLFPFVELRHADFPWRVSPGAADLTPWLVLVVFEVESVQLARKAGASLQVIETTVASLPTLADSTAWAHAQFSGDPTVPIATLVEQSPDRCLARLVAARQLAPSTRYLACVVPAFEAGRLAGLGQTVPDPHANVAAWTTGSVELPVYDSWTFTTGEAGDFETLARRLKPADLAARARPWTVDVSAVASETSPVSMPSALRPVDAESTWTGAAREAARATLAGWLQTEAATTGPVIGPPLYGGLAAGTNVPVAGWLEQLACDPRLRAVAALGAAVARQDQERLVADAWDQVGQLRRANRERDGAALSALVVPRLAARHLAPAGGSSVMAARAAWSRVKIGSQTVAAHIAASTVPPALATAAFRRIAGVRVRGAASALPATIATFSARPPIRGQLPANPAQLVTPRTLSASHVHVAASAIALSPAVLTQIHEVAARTLPVLRVARPQPLAIAQLSTTLITALGSATALARFAARFDRGDLAHEASVTAPIVSEIDLVYSLLQPLAALDRRFILGGVDVPGDSVGMLEPDAAFIEAALVGASHELVREMQWRGAPIDRRVTPCKHFFDARGAEASDDITGVAGWHAAEDLGSHLRDREAAVIIVRGELIRRFPDALIYLAKATRANGRRSPTDTHRIPRFRGALAADSVFVGFDRTADQLRGEDNAGWYIVIAEHAGGPRFGLDEPGTVETLMTWNDLSWRDVAVAGGYVDVASSTPQPTSPGDYRWNRDGGQMAAITLQRPVSVAIHAAGLLPARTA